MAMILLAVEDTDRDAPIRDLLTAEGWWVTTVGSREEALRAAADHAPQLLIIDQKLAGAEDSLRAFLRDGGGCGVLVLVDRQPQDAPPVEAADGWLGRDQEPAALVSVVRATLGRPRRVAGQASALAAPAAADEQLTANELFGDILENLREEGGEETPGEGASGERSASELFGDILEDLGERQGEAPGIEEAALAEEPEPAAAGEDETDEVEALVESLRPLETAADSEPPPVVEPLLVESAEEVDELAPEAAEPERAEPEAVELEGVEPEGVEVALESVELESVELESVELESVELESVELESVELESVELESVELESVEPESVEPESVELESVEPESVEPESVELETGTPEFGELPAVTTGEAPALEGEEAFDEAASASERMAEEPEEVGAGVGSAASETPPAFDDDLLLTVREEDLDEGEQSTELLEEVADLLESGRSAWLASDEPDGDDLGLSIEEVLAVEEPASDGAAVGEGAAASEAEAATSEPASAAWFEEVEEGVERVGPYALLELIEFGDLTERWLARRSDGRGERVVVERVRRELRNRADVRAAFVEGYSEAAGWEHENVLRVVDLGRDGDVDFVATDYRPGHSLREILDRVRRMEARMPMGVSLLIMERLVAAFEVLSRGPAATRHGWVVPGSVWLTDHGAVLLREFGFGRLPAGSSTLALDWSEHRFMAPERWSSRGDLRSDLYSIGALLYEMMCGHPVHRAPDFELLVDTISEVQIVPSQLVDPTIPAEIDAWVMRLLRRNPEERPNSVEEVGGKIDLALQALPARPTTADLSAYVRQIFAARVPKAAAPADEAAAVEIGVDEAAASDESRSRRIAWWWWLLIPLIILLSAYVGWRTLGAGAAAESSRPDEWRQAQATPLEAPGVVSAGPGVH